MKENHKTSSEQKAANVGVFAVGEERVGARVDCVSGSECFHIFGTFKKPKSGISRNQDFYLCVSIQRQTD